MSARYGLCCLFLFLTSLHLLSQNKIDSLQTALAKESSDTGRINTLGRLGNELRKISRFGEAHAMLVQGIAAGQKIIDEDRAYKRTAFRQLGRLYTVNALIYDAEHKPDSAYTNYCKSIRYLYLNDDLTGISNTLLNIGNLEYYRNDFDKAVMYYQASLSLATKSKNKKGVAKANNCIATTMFSTGDLARGLKCALIELSIVQEEKDTAALIHSYNLVGALYNANLDYKKAATYMQKCIDLNKNAPKDILARMYMNLGVCEQNLDHSQSRMHLQKGYDYYVELKDTAGITNCYNNFAILFDNIADSNHKLRKPSKVYYDSAVHFRNRALALIRSDDYRALFESYYGMANEYNSREDFATAAKYYTIARENAEKVGMNEQAKNASLGMYFTYRALNKPLEALKAYEDFNRMRDSVYGSDTQQEIGRLEGKFEADKKLLEQKKENEKQLAVEQEKHRGQRYISLAIAAVLLIVFVFSIVLFNRLKLTRRQKQIIEAQKEQTEAQKKEIEFQKMIVEEHQKELMDSITYASRIQKALMAPENYIEREVTRLQRKRD